MTTLEEKPVPDAEPIGEESSTLHQRTSSTVESVADYLPEGLKKTVVAVAPVVGFFVEFVACWVVPFFYVIYKYTMKVYRWLQPYHVDELVPGFLGLVICFFGGTYLTLIAAVEAYRIVGWQPTQDAIVKISKNARIALDASKKDDEIDADHNGIPDVQEMLDRGETNAVVKRKTGVVLKSVDPQELSEAFNAMNSGFMAVLATLKLQFARAITLGVAIGDMITKPALRFLQRPLEALMGEEYKKWAKPVISYICKAIAISIAWTIQRIISAFHSSIRGGLMFSRALLGFLAKLKLISFGHQDTFIDEIIGFAVAFFGFQIQFTHGFMLPFPLNIIMFPFTILEYVLMWFVNSD